MSSKVSDALLLVHLFYLEKFERENNKNNTNTTQNKTSKTAKSKFTRCFLIICCAVPMAVGLVFGTYTVVSYFKQDQQCHAILGPIQSCARPRMYYSHGFFESTSCAFHKVQTIVCKKHTTKRLTVLPDGVAAYANMTELIQINISNCPQLSNTPRGFGYVPNASLELILDNNPRMHHFEYSICASKNLKTISLHGSNASTSLNWSTQIYDYWRSRSTVATSTPLYINEACIAEFSKTLKVLHLEHNHLACPYQREEDVNSEQAACAILSLNRLLSLTHVNLDGNDFTILGNIMRSKLQHVLINNRVLSSHVFPVSLAGNSIRHMLFSAEAVDDTEDWMSVNIDWRLLEIIDIGKKLLLGVRTKLMYSADQTIAEAACIKQSTARFCGFCSIRVWSWCRPPRVLLFRCCLCFGFCES